MFKELPNTNVQVSDVAGEIPDVQTIESSGAAVNLKDMKLYFIREAGIVESADIEVETLMSLLAVTPSITGRLSFTPVSAFSGTILKMDEIGTIVKAGDKLRLPYGDVVNVLFTTSDNGLVTDAIYSRNVINEAEVARVAAPVSELNNPSELSLLWEGIAAILNPPPQVYSPVGNFFIRAISTSQPTTYIVTGDSTRSSAVTQSIEYYTELLGQINVVPFLNSESGLSAYEWKESSRSAGLADAIAATPGDGSTTIMEYSLGINRETGQDLDDVYVDIKEGITAYLTAKPAATLILCTPVIFESESHLEPYEKLLLDFPQATLVYANEALESVRPQAEYFSDSTHPNINGAKRLINYLLSKVLPEELHSRIELPNSPVVNQPPLDDLPFTVETGFWYTSDGRPSDNADWRRSTPIAVEPNFTLNVQHGGNLGHAIFLDSSGDFVVSDGLEVVAGESYKQIVVPQGAYQLLLNISDSGTDYDSATHTTRAWYEVDTFDYLEQAEINEGLDIPFTVV